MARHPKRQRRLKPKHRRVYTPSPHFEYEQLREKRIRKARRCLIALTAALIAVGIALCIFRAPDGAPIDLPDMQGGATTTVTWGGKTLTFRGGVLTGVSP